MKITVENLFFSYGKRALLHDVSFSLFPGEGLVVLAGANGAGKSTLLKLLCGLLKPEKGKIFWDDREICTIPLGDRARSCGVLLQQQPPALDFTVFEFVLFGRMAKLPRLAPPGPADHQAVEKALSAVRMEGFAHKKANALSGGEFQRICLAAALALESDCLLLDEPASAQDPAQAAMIYSLLKEYGREKTVLMISHDLLLMEHYAQKILLFSDGKILSSGSPEKVLTQENMQKLYGIDGFAASRLTGCAFQESSVPHTGR